VARGVESVAELGATFLTVHAYPQTMKAAVEARADRLKILAVTVLTSYDDGDLHAAGFRSACPIWSRPRPAGPGARRRWPRLFAGRSGALRKVVGHQMNLVTPGHPARGQRRRRPEAHHDAGARHSAGADYLVSDAP
jgi:orotidine-5'-phosphate decarboxylase